MDRLNERVAIVTGGARGLGAKFANSLADEGAKVIIADVLDGSAVATDINARHPGAALDIQTDVTDEASVSELVSKTVSEFGKLDILINNAADIALGRAGPIEQITVESWDSLMAVNLRGPFLCSRAAAPEMRKNNYGKIINLSSGSFFNGAPNYLHYITSKGGIMAMTRCLSRELGDAGIRVNSLAPGLTMSEALLADELFSSDMIRQPQIARRALKREQQPDDLVGALIFLASGDSDFVTGQCLLVDGGAANN